MRKHGELWWLCPDGKTEVTIEYLQRSEKLHKSMAVKRQDVDVLSRSVPPPGIDDVGFDSSSRLQQ